VFVEQRLYPMCMRQRGVRARYFLRDYRGEVLADGTRNDTFTHLWMYKRRLVANPEERRRLCARMIRRIARDLPDVLDTVLHLPEIDAELRKHAMRD
jgi:hypothetical protein